MFPPPRRGLWQFAREEYRAASEAAAEAAPCAAATLRGRLRWGRLTPAEREGVQALRKCLQNNHDNTSKSHGVEADEAERLLAWLQEREEEW